MFKAPGVLLICTTVGALQNQGVVGVALCFQSRVTAWHTAQQWGNV